MGDAIGRLWVWLRGHVAADAGHLHSQLFPQEDAVAMTPNDSYLRVWLSELFLARQTAWGNDRSPAVQAMIRMPFAGFSSLLTPLSAALAVAGQVAAGVEKVIAANAREPVLTVDKAHAAPGGGGPNDLVPGYLARDCGATR